jgi:hypothetical protein
MSEGDLLFCRCYLDLEGSGEKIVFVLVSVEKASNFVLASKNFVSSTTTQDKIWKTIVPLTGSPD